MDIAREHQLIIFADEIYDRLVMDGEEHISIASLAPDLFCVTLNGLSKSHRIAGFRVGWMCLSGDKSCARIIGLPSKNSTFIVSAKTRSFSYNSFVMSSSYN